MSLYSIRLKIMPTGAHRLPIEPFRIADFQVLPNTDGSAQVLIEPIEAPNAQHAFDRALAITTRFVEYLALLGSDSGFMTTGLGDVTARNLDLSENPLPPSQPPPFFESIGGIVTDAGQAFAGQRCDPDGSKRRSGIVLVHNLTLSITPGETRTAELIRLWQRDLTLPRRLQTAIGILHDAACAREPSHAFAQTYTALEVLIEAEPAKTAVDVAMAENSASQVAPQVRKAALREAMSGVLNEHNLPAALAERMIEHAFNARSVSQIDVAFAYFNRVGIAVDRNSMRDWRALRGALVHAAGEREDSTQVMDAFRRAVTSAVIAELRSIDAARAA